MKLFSHILKAMPLGLLYILTLFVFYQALFSEKLSQYNFDNSRTIVFFILLPLLTKYLVQLLSSPIYSLKEFYRSRKFNNENLASVSVLIPAYNEEVGIIKTIKSVLATNYPKLEVVVINDGSSDQTHELITDFIKQHKANALQAEIKYLRLTNGGKSTALNEALKVATNDIIMTIDGDCIMDENAIINTVKQFSCDKVGAVAGNVVVGNKSKPIEVIQQLEYLSGFFFRRADSVFNAVFIIGGAAAAYRASVLKEVGDFSQDIVTEDIEMSTRILAAGYKTRYAADAVTYTEGPSNWQCLCDQRLRWKFGRFQTFIKFKKLFFSTQKKHSKYLTWLVLPIALYAELVLLLEAFILAFFFTYTIISNDYMPLAMMIAFMAILISLQVTVDSKKKFHANLLLLAPVAWLLFYIVDVVEFQALYRSLKRLFKRQGLQWQKWVRVGI